MYRVIGNFIGLQTEGPIVWDDCPDMVRSRLKGQCKFPSLIRLYGYHKLYSYNDIKILLLNVLKPYWLLIYNYSISFIDEIIIDGLYWKEGRKEERGEER